MQTDKMPSAWAYGFTVIDDDDMIVLTTRDGLMDPGEPTPLWSRSFDWPVERYAFGSWLADRRHLWDDWGRLAEQEGAGAVETCIARLLDETPPDEPSDAVFRKDGDPLVLHIDVVFGDGSERVIGTHRFSSGRARTRFLRLFGKRVRIWSTWDVVEIAWLHGPRVLALYLDRFVSAMTFEPVRA